MLKITKTSTKLIKSTMARNISCTARLALDQKWREEQGLPENPNEFGPLTNLPDYTFLDGRPTPLGSNQRKRLIKQQEIAAKIVTMNKELDMAKQRYKQLQEQQAAERQKVMQAKLKPKGKYLLEQKK
ncbi:39S ribosomal protein L52, mitochondrial [Lucilia cuprina]|uniref:Large ribosomal subunit protein mL52 n=1 Tax=Lucilia cuprina TaxID=7375 RepID=A0A0L0BYI9_LUCCU|nr:mitochondrial, 39S ribosomal protein L52 [Lucilia cuprina]KNC25108.1 39S ribosomal protein L52, mitochondrial [Lucilia cuprina]